MIVRLLLLTLLVLGFSFGLEYPLALYGVISSPLTLKPGTSLIIETSGSKCIYSISNPTTDFFFGGEKVTQSKCLLPSNTTVYFYLEYNGRKVLVDKRFYNSGVFWVGITLNKEQYYELYPSIASTSYVSSGRSTTLNTEQSANNTSPESKL